MSLIDLLFTGVGLTITDFTITTDFVVLAATPNSSTACCPKCGVVADRVHSRYRRTIADLPMGGRRLALRLLARRFFCSNAGCQRTIFCERLPMLVDAHARSTNRLADLHRAVGFVASGEPGSRLAEELALPASGDTILRRVTDASADLEPPVRCLGIDDFALRKGQNYGTILIDLERGRVVDILKGRESSEVEAWLKAHPGVEVITRDRASAYANAAANGAPQAMQVADRWHLLKNLREAVERLLDRRRTIVQANLKSQTPLSGDPLGPSDEWELPTFVDAPIPPPVLGTEIVPPSLPEVPSQPEAGQQPETRPLTAREQAREAKRQARAEQFDRVHQLHRNGESIRQIAQMLDLNRETVARYLQEETFPERRSALSNLGQASGYRDHIDHRFGEGCRNAAELHRELVAKDFDVSYYAVRRYVRRRLVAMGGESAAKNSSSLPVPRVPSAKQLAFTIIRKPEERDDEERVHVEILNGIDDELTGALELVIQLAAMIRGLLAQTLQAWLTKADASACPEIRNFARTLRQDEKAVQAGMTEAWSNGPVEGQVNRLKTIKRQMYGRAGFELLRARVRAA
ncbi:MAG TPA: ISL3 family transposase [Bryobacteraceae bacterium]|jgi:transposase